MDAGDYSPAPATAALSEDSYLGPMMKMMKNRKRFSDEQVRSLESMFDEETKLEPRKKLQLARDLGLQPRQIAIWFQNRRARWKSKHLEQEYNLLRANYDDLAASLESLHKEKQCLLKQVQELKKQLEESQKDNMRKSKKFVSDAGDAKPINYEDKPPKQLAEAIDLQAFGDSDGESAHRFQLEKVDLINIGDVAESSTRWPGEWHEIDTSSFSDQSCSTIEWWDFWA